MTMLKTIRGIGNSSRMDINVIKNRKVKLVTAICFVTLLSLAMLAQNSSAIIIQNYSSWFLQDTVITAVAAGDVDNDGIIDIVTGGYQNDGSRWVAQLVVWNSLTLAVKRVTGWVWGSDTQVTSVAIGDVDGDGGSEIVTGGTYFDNTTWIAQLVVWNGSTLGAERVQAWNSGNNTQIASIAFGDVDVDGGIEIVSGGAFFDNTRWVSQLAIWNGSTLEYEQATGWYRSSNTYIDSVAVGNVDADVVPEIVTGGAFLDGVRYNAQLVVFNGSALTVQGQQTWFWTGNTEISDVAVGDVDGDNATEVVTGGSYFDNIRYNAQLVVWNGSSLAVENVKTWYDFASNATISSVAYGDVDGNGVVDVVTGGKYFDGVRWNAQISIQPGNTLLGNTGTTWFTTSDSYIEAIDVGNIGGTNRVVTGGAFFDLIRTNAQLTIWG